MTLEQIEQIANVVLKSAGSGLCHYTPYSRERILKELTDHLEGYALVPIVTKEQALDAFNFIERKLSVGLDEMGHSEFADMDTHYAMSVLYHRADIHEALKQSHDRLVGLVDCLFKNDPDDAISDAGHTVLQLWRHDAEKALAEAAKVSGK